MTGRRLQGWFAAIAMAAICGIGPLSLWGQDDDDFLSRQTDLVHSQQMPRDYRAYARLSQLERDLATKAPDQFEAAAEEIQELLDQPYDYFLLAGPRVGTGLRARLDELMRTAPAEFRAQYERRFGAEARELLGDADRAKEWSRLGEVIRRFAWTSSGRQALEIQAMAYADQGELARAARTLDTLLTYTEVPKNRPDLAIAAARYWRTAGRNDAAVATLARLKREFGDSVPLGGTPVPLFATDDAALPWLDEQSGGGAGGLIAAADVKTWRLPRGSESGLASAEAASPLASGAWEAPLLDGFDIDPIFPQDPKVQENLKDLQRTMAEREKKFIELNSLKRPLAPAAVPLCVGGTVIVSGPGSIKAYEAASGKFLWTTVEVDNTFLTLNRLATQTSNSLTYRRLIDAFFAQRMWLNRTAGQLTSDGDYVYAVIDTGLMIAPRAMPFGPMVARNAPQPRSDNRLVAFELATDGTIRWSMGGRVPTQGPMQAETPIDVAESLPGLMGVYFLGAPLPADGVLYVLGEDRGQVKLFALAPRPKTPRGEVLWSLPLLNPTPNSFLLDNAERRMGGMTPVLENGVLVCELMDGVVTAVDPVQRRVLWSRRYRPAEPQMNRQFLIMQAMNAAQQGEEAVVEDQLREIGWWDTNPVVAGDTVLMTPSDSDQLLGLRLASGEDAWPSLPRGDAMYLASATPEQFVVIEPRAVEARSTATGKSLWRRPLEAPGVSGRGLRQGDRLTLPLGSGELVTIDLRSGQILAQSPLPPRVRSGNLVAAGGQLVLQTASRVYGYPSLTRLQQEIEAQLARAPRDPEALANRGALRLHQGEFASGQADLRAALESLGPDGKNPAARRLLVGSLLADLRRDFSKSQGTLAELNRLAVDPSERFWLHLTTADGLQRSGDETGALREYFRVPFYPGTEDLEPGLTVSKHRWVRGKIDDLRNSSKNPAALAETIAALLDQAARSGDEPAIELALSRLGLQPGIEKTILARKESAADPQRDASLAQRRQEQELWWILSDGADAARPAAAARLIPPRLRRGITEPVTDLLDAFATRWSGTPVQGGKTGKEWLAAWEDDPALGGPLQVRPRWEAVKLEVDPPTESKGPPRLPVPVPLLGPNAGPLDGSLFAIVSPDQKLVARNRYGAEGQLDAQTGMDLNSTIFQSRYVNTIGRLVVYVATDQFLIVDSATNQIVFKDFLVERSHLQAIGNPRGRAFQPEDLEEGVRGLLLPGLSPGSFAGNVGQPTYTSLCYQRSDELVCIDPASGETQWTRTGVPEGSEILMDEEYTVLCPPLTNELIVYRTADGRHVGRASVPKDVVKSRRGAEWGRFLLTATPEPDKITYAMFDPASSRTVWSREFPTGTEWTSADGENIALLAPSGQFEVIDFRTGKGSFSAKLSEIPKLDGFQLRRDGQRFVVLSWLYGLPSHNGPTPKADPRTRQVHPQGHLRHFESFDRTEFSGPLFLVDGAGKILWTRPAPKYRSLLVSNTVPSRWPILAVAEEHDSPAGGGNPQGWSWEIEILDVRSGTSLRQEKSTDRLKAKEHFVWRTDALNRLSLSYSNKTYTVRLMGPGSGAGGGTGGAKLGDSQKAPPPQEEEKPPEQTEKIREI